MTEQRNVPLKGLPECLISDLTAFLSQCLGCPGGGHCFAPPGLSSCSPGKARQCSKKIQSHSTGKKRCMGWEMSAQLSFGLEPGQGCLSWHPGSVPCSSARDMSTAAQRGRLQLQPRTPTSFNLCTRSKYLQLGSDLTLKSLTEI